MKNLHSKHFFLFVLLFLCSFMVFAQLSRKHYIPPLTYAEFGNAIPQEQYIYISTPNNQEVAYTITFVGQPAASNISGTVSNNNPEEVFVGNGPGQLFQPSPESSTVITDRGFIIEADDLVYVSVRMRGGNNAQAGALVSKGNAALGTVFRSGSYTNENPQTNYLNFFSFMATENNTNITIDDLPPGIAIRNYTGTFPINVNLNEGESYVVATNSAENTVNWDGLIGTLIESDKPIVVNAGSANGSFHNGGGRDYGLDQIVDFSSVGNEYIFVRGDGVDTFENILVVAHEDNTNIFVNGNTTPLASINAGDYFLIEGNFYNTDGNMYVSTSRNVFMYQGVGGNGASEANQGLFFVPPLSCNNRGRLDNIANITNIGTTVYTGGITIVTNRGATVEINDQPIANFAPLGPFDVDGNPDYVTYKVIGLTSNVSVESSDELYCAYFNFNGAATSGSFYSGFPTPPEINFETNIAALGNCIPNVTLESLNTDLFDSIEWFFDDGSGFVSTGNTSSSFVPTQPGNYRLVGTLVCSGEVLESASIPVSRCPDDFDGDGVIDNIDVDLDNDGVLNCVESLGDADLNFTDINQPVVVFNDGSTNNTFVTASVSSNGTTTLTGDATSNFTSTLNAGTNVSQEYSLTFDQASNITFTQQTGTTHTVVTGETFILSIGPNSKNITLFDPDDQLLIDTDFDGFYETGVNNYSSSEVRFQFNPTPNGTTPFQMVAHNIENVTLQHNLVNTTNNSTLQANLIINCFGIDSDGDGVVNSMDADSDNDGIMDIIEALSNNVVIAGVDSNFDGLDDFFNNVVVIPFDSDGDGVVDMLDLDSDNDGVYDVFEAGHALPDADLDGRIDNAAAISGINGLADVLESSPDSFILGFAAEGLDADSELNYFDLDTDGDGCPDVIEAGYSDPDNDDRIGISPVTIDVNGKVIGISDGYTVPNANYTINAPLVINTAFEDVRFCDESPVETISIDSTADTFQWEISTDGGATWTTLVDDAVYSGTTTATLQINNMTLAYNGHQFRVMLERAGNSCGEISNAITLTVDPLPVINTLVALTQCDDDTDGFSAFNLFEAGTDISANFMNETFVFYPTEIDAINDTNAFTTAEATAYTNQTVTSDTVWARVISTFGCFRIAQVDLTVATNASGVTNFTPRVYNVCDDFLDINGDNNANNDDTDGVTAFDFSDVTDDLLNEFPVAERPNLIITYYRNDADAFSESDAIADISNYRNIGYPNSQQIYVRVDNVTNNDCIGLLPLITLNVDPVPVYNPVADIEECDNSDDGNPTNGFVQNFNIENQTALILGSQDPTNFSVTYHLSAADATSGANAITNTTLYTNTTVDRQTIYVRVTNNTTGCYVDRGTFDLIVNPIPTANFVADLEVCDEGAPGTGQDGFASGIDLEVQTLGILGSQDPAQFTVTYHRSFTDARDDLNAIVGLYTNETAFTQTIYIRIVNDVTGCINNISNFNLIVNTQPTVEDIVELPYCDDDLDGDDTNGFVQNIDLDSQIPLILGSGQDEDDFTVTFHEFASDAVAGTNALSSPYSNTTQDQQTIYVRVVNDDTGCVNSNYSFNIVVNPLPEFDVTSPQTVCLNDPDLTLEVENPAGIYDYVWTDPEGNETIGSQISATVGGIYSVTATATDGTGCQRTREIEVIESIIATVTDADITIVDDSENNSISIDRTNLGIGDYEYALADENGIIVNNYQDDPLFENLEGGFYTILIRDKNGCGVASLEVPVVVFPSFFTPNNDGINDTWEIKGANSVFFPDSQVNIFNRFGKVVAQINIDNAGWDGTFNGKTLPSDDYWFSIKLVDRNGNVRERKGNMSLLRR